ncbi:uncharacterized protein EAF01_001102 [Botrytis porri]|uniref:F-box domain-containing protein n=1 Tax=Botrytis porri TaxID=87229 RepID=A0A4Z1KSA4_9HELO|nr:uncharacterized protein EAF01_001102 [Botrytis porri]KAF7914696.1 hypothetical protein EAF01_001102 [Botrytis porri]TGO85485.1 hypothetical protein BPOR_0392g00100 [Botrytis porri]
MVDSFTGITSLPNEILINVLSLFSTRRLLPLACTCHRFHHLIIRIIHHRLIAAASLKNHELILECFHPSTKLITPYALCNYLGTDGLSDDVVGEGDIYKDVNNTGRLGKMAGLYSRFRPLQSEERIRHLAGSARPTLLPESDDGLVSQIVDLESHELFSQLCTITNIVKVGPKRGLFLSCVNIGEGVIRVFRDWLTDRVEANERHIDSPEECAKRLLWTDTEKHVGLKFKVSKWEGPPAPILLHRDEEAPVFYKLQYEELVLRTTQLLLHVEESLTRQVGHSSKAIVIGSWDY